MGKTKYSILAETIIDLNIKDVNELSDLIESNYNSWLRENDMDHIELLNRRHDILDKRTEYQCSIAEIKGKIEIINGRALAGKKVDMDSFHRLNKAKYCIKKQVEKVNRDLSKINDLIKASNIYNNANKHERELGKIKEYLKSLTTEEEFNYIIDNIINKE